jgi:uncharacterized repeat protein (TIGR03843 family)
VELTDDDVAAVLERGTLDVVGRMRYSSNGACLVRASADGVSIEAVYKPRRGERPLWDFPDGTLCCREVAAYEVSKALGWSVVPVTVMRADGPYGDGAVQRFVQHDSDEHYFTLLGDHEDRFREFAAFDVVANNADRKGGHCLHDLESGRVVGIDHGLTFHVQWKLRTVIWDFAGEAIAPALLDDLARFSTDLDGPVGRRLADLLHPAETATLGIRVDELRRAGEYPQPDLGYRSVPWPLV